MATLMDKKIQVNRTIAIACKHAKALEDQVRSEIVTMLYNQELSAEQIGEAINKMGFKKTLSTLRHHLRILKNAGLIEVVKIAESNRGLTQYYGTSTRMLNFEAPENFESMYSNVVNSTAKKLEDTLGEVLTNVAESNSKHTDEYSLYLVMEVMNRSMTKVFEQSRQRGSKKKTVAKTTREKNSSTGGRKTGEKTGNG